MEREFSIRSVFLPQGLTERTKDFILALGIAFVGCIGSYFILGGSIQNLHINGIRYLIDFGNGIRSSFDQRSVSMRYNDPGIYIAQSYVWESEKWKLIAAQTLTIHP